MNEYNLCKLGNNLDQWALYDDSELGGGVFIATINGRENAFKILNLLNGVIYENYSN